MPNDKLESAARKVASELRDKIRVSGDMSIGKTNKAKPSLPPHMLDGKTR